jgi:hypothetical protein
MDLILIGHKKKRNEYFSSTKMWKQALKHEIDQLSILAMENCVKFL